MCELTGSTACARPSTDARSGVPAWPVVLRRSVMKLYYAPGACSLSPPRVMGGGGAMLKWERVKNKKKKTKSGADYWGITPKGKVPVLEFDKGERLRGGRVVVRWFADQTPAAGLIPAAGKPERYR